MVSTSIYESEASKFFTKRFITEKTTTIKCQSSFDCHTNIIAKEQNKKANHKLGNN
jgi:hypothetical protein